MTHEQLRRTFERIDAQHIGRCVRVCAAARDERGRWRAEAECARELAAPGLPSSVDKSCAAAARRIGAWLAGVGK